MAYTNNLLLNNVFLKNLRPTDQAAADARYLVHGSARDWFHNADLSGPAAMVDTWIQSLLNQQSLDLVPANLGDENAWNIVAPWDRVYPPALCYVAPHGTDLDGYSPDGILPKGQHWMIRTVNLARRAGCENLHWVVLTNGERWRLLDACALRRYEAFLEVDLYHLLSGWDLPRITKDTPPGCFGLKGDIFGEILHILRSDISYRDYVKTNMVLQDCDDMRDSRAI